MTTSGCTSHAGYRIPAEIVSHAVWLYFRTPLNLRIVDKLLAASGIIVSRETVRQWALKFGQGFANQFRSVVQNERSISCTENGQSGANQEIPRFACDPGLNHAFCTGPSVGRP